MPGLSMSAISEVDSLYRTGFRFGLGVGRCRVSAVSAMLKRIYLCLRQKIVTYRQVLRDRRTPKSAKWLLRLLLGYILTPFDLIRDCIPVLVCLTSS